MHRGDRKKKLTGHVSARLTSTEDEQVKERAAAAGITKSEWCRRAILASVSISPETRLLLSELLAFRKVAVWLQVQASKGLPLEDNAIKKAVEQAEVTKLVWADERIARYLAADVEEPAA